MHILFIADASTIHSYRWIKYFSKIKGMKVTWCSMTENTMPELDNVEYKFINKKNPLNLIKTIRYISKIAPDIIHVHYLGWNGFLSLFFPKSKIVLTAWGSDIVVNSQKWLKKLILQKMVKRASVITCDADHLRKKLVDLGAEQENIKIVMFGIDKETFTSDRIPFDVQGKNVKFNVGSIRNLHPVYDVITFLKAAKIVLDKRQDVNFNVAGSGPDLQYLQNFVDEHDLKNNIKFIGRLDSSELYDFYNSLDIYVSTSLSDGGIASSTAEAMLCARPVIVTDAADNREWVTDKDNGRLFDCRDFENLALIINELLNDHQNSQKLGLKAKKTIMRLNEYNNEMKRMLKIYHEI